MVNEDLEIWEEEDIDLDIGGEGVATSDDAETALADLMDEDEIYSFWMWAKTDTETAAIGYYRGSWYYYPWDPRTVFERWTGSEPTTGGQIMRAEDARKTLFSRQVKKWKVHSQLKHDGRDYKLDALWNEHGFQSTGWVDSRSEAENKLASGEYTTEEFLGIAESYNWTFDQNALPEGVSPEHATKYEATRSRPPSSTSSSGLIIVVAVGAFFLMNQ